MRIWLALAIALLLAPTMARAAPSAQARSLAAFAQMGQVLQSPRCLNCHPAGSSPTQGEAMLAHLPAAPGGADGHGIPGLPCAACHQAANTPVSGERIRSVPGNPKWALAPPQMAWQGKTLGQICRQLKDPARNGGRSLEALWRHMAHDDLVGWGWSPGEGRRPAPGSQAVFGKLARTWIDTGAACPP